MVDDGSAGRLADGDCSQPARGLMAICAFAAGGPEKRPTRYVPRYVAPPYRCMLGRYLLCICSLPSTGAECRRVLCWGLLVGHMHIPSTYQTFTSETSVWLGKSQ